MQNTLGQQVHSHLKKLKIESPYLHKVRTPETQQRIAEHFQKIMLELGLDLKDDSLKATPRRVAKMYTQEIFSGLDYNNFPEVSSFQNKMKVDEMIVNTARVMSTCEHHLVPFIGTAYIGYIPNTRIIGLSKIPRIVDFFARRPQIQERLTEQVAATLKFILETEDIAIVTKAEHYCIKIRGVKDDTSITTTSHMGGKFRSNPAARGEFLALVNS